MRRMVFMFVVFAVAWPAPAVARSGIDVRTDIRYATHAGIELRLDVYLPPGRGPFPAVVVIPGGRWVNIDKAKHEDVPTYFADHGIAAFSIEYRSALEFPFPAALEDVRAAIRWVRAHARDYDVDPDQLGAIGVSAGGHLAALVGAMGAGPLDEGTRVNVVASWSGPMDLRPLVDSRDSEVREPVRVFLGCPDGNSCTPIAREASPVTHVGPTDPPMVLVNSGDEIIPVDQAQEMSTALDDVGVENDLRIVQGNHGAGYGGGEKVLDLVIPYVQSWIRGRSTPTPIAPSDGADNQAKADAQPASGTPAVTAPAGDEKGTDATESAFVPKATDPVNLVVLTIAIGALVLVVVQRFMIAGLRRRPTLPPTRGSGGAEVGEA